MRKTSVQYIVMLAFEEQNNILSLCSHYKPVCIAVKCFCFFQKMLMSLSLKECQTSTEQEQDFPR